MNGWKTYFGMAAGALTTISFVPQLVKVLETKSTHDISSGMFLIFSAGVGLWLIYGTLLHDIPIIISNTITLGLALTILVLKFKYR